MNRSLLSSCFALCAGLFTVGNAQSLDNPNYRVETYASGISNPVAFQFISYNTMLVCERLTGRVTVWVNGVFSGSALDLPVANSGEEGLLGICADNNFASNKFIYLFYSRAASDGGSWLEDRVDRYQWNGSTLAFINNVFTTPFDASQNNPAFHHGGYIKMGPDDKLYIWGGELTRGRSSNPRIEQNTNSTAVAGAGAIYRMNPDGTIPSDNPFTYHSDPRIRAIWIYGVRNGFGFSFDPLNQNFWFSENGPDKYDELNLGYAGMNSGWLKIMGPDSRNAVYSDNNNTAYNSSDLVYLTGATYSDPKFSWLNPIGVTSVEFLSGYKYVGAEANMMLAGDVNFGQIYLFSFTNSNRDTLFYLPGTSDGVADSATERNQYRFGFGFGGVTDMRIAPDGMLYVCDTVTGRIFRIRPKNEPFAPDGIQINFGTQTGGDLRSFEQSDDNKFAMRAIFRANSITPPIQYELTAHASSAGATGMHLMLESSTDSMNVQQLVEFRNFANSSWELIDARPSPQSDTRYDFTITGDANRFINPTDRLMRARVTFRQTGPTLNLSWRGLVDQFNWQVQS